MDIGKELQALYDSEINFSISTEWDAGYHWKLGDEMNGFVAEGWEKPIEAAVEQLLDAVRKHRPQSEYVVGKEKFEQRYHLHVVKGETA